MSESELPEEMDQPEEMAPPEEIPVQEIFRQNLDVAHKNLHSTLEAYGNRVPQLRLALESQNLSVAAREVLIDWLNQYNALINESAETVSKWTMALMSLSTPSDGEPDATLPQEA